MLSMVLFFMLQKDVFVGGGISIGTNFTNTNVHIAPSISVHSFPFSVKNIGIFNTIEWQNYHLNNDPFRVNIKNKTFIVGSTVRMLKPKIQPSLRVGLAHFRENTEVTFYNNLFASGKAKKNTLFFGGGVYVGGWKKFYMDPEISFILSGRPPWRVAVRAGWIF